MRPDIDIVLRIFSYNPETGVITRTEGYGRAIAGQTFIGDCSISVIGVHVRSNILAWALHNKMWPPKGYWVDHKSRIRDDITIKNLRLVTPTQNQQNKAGYGGFLLKGVTLRKDFSRKKPYQARIRIPDGRRILLGSFVTEEEASRAYQEACLKYHGEFACPE